MGIQLVVNATFKPQPRELTNAVQPPSHPSPSSQTTSTTTTSSTKPEEPSTETSIKQNLNYREKEERGER
jgi:hypothetical protein